MSEIKLNWCVGKFTYHPSAAKPVHALALPQFLLDRGLDLSAIAALRDTRAEADPYDIDLPELSEWIARSGGQELVNMLNQILIHDNKPLIIVDLLPGIGLTFEVLKESLISRPSTKITYVVSDQQRDSVAFAEIHSLDVIPYGSASGNLAPADATVRLLNHLHMVRHDPEGATQELANVLRSSQPTLLAARAHGGLDAAAAVTVNGNVISLPALTGCLKEMVAGDATWFVKWLPSFDAGYLLPSGLSAGALFASNAESMTAGDGYVEANEMLARLVAGS